MRFEKVLVANRGEIALRVLRTCRDMGLATVAVYSDADADAPHVRFADEAVRLGPAPAAESYLSVEAILEAARRSGAEAVHPGYGFLAENAAFARACGEAGLVFVGPRPETIDAMGDKGAARRLMAERGVPVAPGYAGEDQSDARLCAEAEAIGFPVLVKATAGGGGKGMSIVRSADALPAALGQARRLARSAFGDDTLLVEKYVDSPRHVEVQILGDSHGHVVHCFERECSIQRRFQKIIEESPSPAVDDALRERLCTAGIAAGQALGYVGAGTVEFILDPDGQFYFLEVNTRLQVEHPVTELITGLDLVRLQIQVAQGAHLPPQEAIRGDGHAVECRLYAEDAAHDFLPATGTVVEWDVPDLPHVRVDAGVAAGSPVGIHYDPLLAKVITWGPTRAEANLRMIGALRRLGVQGLTTNRDFLLAVLRHPRYAEGALSTHFVPTHLADWRPSVDGAAVADRAVAAALFDAAGRADGRALMPALRAGFRNNPWRRAEAIYAVDGEAVRVDYAARRDGGWDAAVGEDDRVVRVVARDGAALTLDLAGRQRTFHVVVRGDHRFVRDLDGSSVLVVQPRFPDADAAEAEGGCTAPMPGRVVQVLVEAGQRVARGAALVVLEAMKMEHTLTAPEDGVVATVRCAEGDVVDAGAVLVELEAAPGE